MEESLAENPIGIFDSGLGGLSVVKKLKQVLPYEKIMYCADSKHLPYGNKSPEEIRQCSSVCIQELIKKKIKVLLIACHTASIPAKKLFEQSFSIPVLGIHEASIEAFLQNNRIHRLGIIGTEATIRSNFYQMEFQKLKSIETVQIAAPTLVPLIESSTMDHQKILLELQQYYTAFSKYSIDTLLLACTHYPLILESFQKSFPSISLIDPSTIFAQQLADFLKKKKLINQSKRIAEDEFWVTGDPEIFRAAASRFLHSSIEKVFHLDCFF